MIEGLSIGLALLTVDCWRVLFFFFFFFLNFICLYINIIFYKAYHKLYSKHIIIIL